MKRLQIGSTGWIGDAKRASMRQSLVKQNAFARRVGLVVLTLCFNLLLGSVVVIGLFAAAVELRDSGLLSYPGNGHTGSTTFIP